MKTNVHMTGREIIGFLSENPNTEIRFDGVAYPSGAELNIRLNQIGETIMSVTAVEGMLDVSSLPEIIVRIPVRDPFARYS